MAAAFSTVVGQSLSASPTVNFSRIRIPPANFRLRATIMANSYLRTCTMAMATSGDNSINSPEVADVPPKLQERDFMGTPYVPVYVMLPMGIIDMECEIVDADGLLNQLKTLKAANIDGVTIECWWGIVEAHAPHKYNWNGYKTLFKIIRDINLKIRVVMSFHECEGSVGDDVYIPLPRWVTEIGDKNPDIYFTDKDLRRNHECLTWGIDKERVLRGRTALEVYFDLMRNFRIVFDEFLEYRIISHIEVGLGPRGELRYPSHSAKFGWKYPGIGEFQCYDKYLYKSLQKAAEAWGTSLFGKGPENTGSFNSKPQNTQFFRDGGEYNSFYGTFFLDWYFQVLIDHADRVLGLADLAFKGTPIAAKLPGIHWWRNTNSHAAELTAGFHHRCYSRIASTLKKHESTLNFACLELGTRDEEKEFLKALADPKRPVWEKEFLEASADPYRLVLEVLNAAWVAYIPAAGENARPIYHREGYNRILENAKPLGDPSCRRRLSVFTYLRLGPTLLEKHNLMEFGRFVQKMHGEVLTPINLKY